MPKTTCRTTRRILSPSRATESPRECRSLERAIRRGQVAKVEVVEAINAAERQLLDLSDDTALPDQPDRDWVDAWLLRTHLAYWDR